MPAVILKPVVSAKGIDREEAVSLAEAAATLTDGQWASDGTEYATRSEANKVAAKYVRVIESMYDGVSLRSRTWEQSPDKWVFGIRPKGDTENPEGEGDDTGEGDDDNATPDSGEPEATSGEPESTTRSGRPRK